MDGGTEKKFPRFQGSLPSFGVLEMFIMMKLVMVPRVFMDVKFTEQPTLDMCNFMHVNYASMREDPSAISSLKHSDSVDPGYDLAMEPLKLSLR